MLQIHHGRRLPDWDEAQQIAESHARWVLLPDGMTLPENSDLQAYQTAAFDQEVLLHTANALIAQTRMPLYRRVLGLIDEDGAFAGLLHPLLHHYSTVRVLTHNQRRYGEVAEQLMEELGAPVLVGDRLSAFSDCVLVLCPGDFHSREDFRLTCPVMTLGTCSLLYRYQQVSQLRAGLPRSAGEPPSGIAPHRLAGALYELSEAREISPVAVEMLLGGRRTGLQDVVGEVLRASGVPGEAGGSPNAPN